MKTRLYDKGFSIKAAATCDLNFMECLDNKTLIERYPTLKKHRTDLILEKVLGVSTRYHIKKEYSAADLARSALRKLLQSHPELLEECDFVIYAGISSPHPTVCMASLLSHECGIKNTSCWDLKSGCSTGVLSLIQALDRIRSGAQKGIIVLAEALSKFMNPADALNYMALGDGAVAVYLEASEEWKVSGVIHGTDPRFMEHLYIPMPYPSSVPENPTFQLQKSDELASSLDYYWLSSLEELLKLCHWQGREVNFYIAHQINESKNKFFAQMATIPEKNIFMNLREMGNLGCPSIFYNYLSNILSQSVHFSAGDKVIFHAVGGGISWAGIALEKI